MTKYVLIDIDGVINALSGNAPKQNTGWEGVWSLELIEGYNILWSHELIEELNRIISKDNVVPVIASTWQDLGRDVLFPQVGLILPDDVHVFKKDESAGWGYTPANTNWFSWKLDNFKNFYNATDEFIWLDDDIRYSVDSKDWVSTMPNVHVICPNASHGLSRKELALLYEWTD